MCRVSPIPGGNLTGFTVLEPTLGAKLLELLKDIAPSVTHVAVMFNLDNPGNEQLFEAAVAAKNLGVEVIAAQFAIRQRSKQR